MVNKLLNYLKENIWIYLISTIIIIEIIIIGNYYMKKDVEKISDTNKEINLSILNERIIEDYPHVGVYPEKNIVSESMDILYKNIYSKTKVNWKYINMLIEKPLYADKRPNIFMDLSVREIYDGKIDLKEFNEYKTYNTERPNKYYLPDVVYSISSDLISIREKREKSDNRSEEFSLLSNEIKNKIFEYEAVIQFKGISVSEDKVLSVYKEILNTKEYGEIVWELNKLGEITLKEKFKEIISKYYKNKEELEYVSKVIALDGSVNYAKLNKNDTKVLNKEDVVKRKEYIPFYYSRENMMIAALNLVGNVRYVWGGGHEGTSQITGINPMWKEFNQIYRDEGKDGYCIMPLYTWCPIHGTIERSSNGCAFSSPTFSLLSDAINDRKDIYKNISIDKIEKVFNRKTIGYGNSVPLHRLDGLDCSGFASWLYNQVDNKIKRDSVANDFVNTCKEIDYKTERIMPGDVIAWYSHIVVVVGEIEKNSNCYLIVESSPNQIKYGVAYYGNGYKYISKTKELAQQLNDTYIQNNKEKVHTYNIETCGITKKKINENNQEGINEEDINWEELFKDDINEQSEEDKTDIPIEQNEVNQEIQDGKLELPTNLSTQSTDRNKSSESINEPIESSETKKEPVEEPIESSEPIEEPVDESIEPSKPIEEPIESRINELYEIKNENGYQLQSYKIGKKIKVINLSSNVNNKDEIKDEYEEINTLRVGRNERVYLDEKKIIKGYNRSFEELYAKEIIEIITK